MAQTVQFVRMTPAALSAYTGPVGQAVINLTTFGIHVQDGVTAGGSFTLMGGNNFSDVPNKPQACSNLGLGTAAFAATTAFDAAGTAATAQAAAIASAVASGVQKAANGSDFSNAATTRVNLGLAIGTNVQAQSAMLQSLVNTGGTATTLPYLSGTNTYTLAPITAFGVNSWNYANAAAARTAISCPDSTGGGASGTWGISITGSSATCTGNAASATTATTANTATTATNLSGGSVAATTITATGEITAFVSDIRLKRQLGSVENALEKILSLPIFYYEMNKIAQGLGLPAGRRIGTSAQAIAAVAPEAIRPAPIDDKYLTYQDNQLLPLVIAALQELAQQVAEIRKTLNA